MIATIPRNNAPGRRNAALDPAQIFLGRGTTYDTRDLRTGTLQVFTVILLVENNGRIEEGKAHHHNEVQNPVAPGTCTVLH